MPRTGRAAVGGICYHVIKPSNAQNAIFHKSGDYQSFVELIWLACARIPMRVLAYCVMPNHFHLFLWLHSGRDFGRWMRWLLTIYLRLYHQHYRSVGQVCC